MWTRVSGNALRSAYMRSVIEVHAPRPAITNSIGAGPAPFDFIMAGLGACTSMTLRMYAERKALPLTRVHIELSHQKIEVDGVSRDHILRTITLEGDLTPEQRTRMLEIAGRCPTARILSQPLILDCKLAD